MFIDVKITRKMMHALGMFNKTSENQTRQYNSTSREIAKKLHAKAASEFHLERFKDPLLREKNKHTTDEYYSNPENLKKKTQQNKDVWTAERKKIKKEQMIKHVNETNAFDRLSNAGKQSWLVAEDRQSKIDKMAIGHINKAIKNYPKLITSDDLINFRKFIVSLKESSIKIQETYGISYWSVLNWRKEYV